ncbi:sensor histidine kinase [Novosphingobium rosa]|uniref:sensor histidine kinase n=1 Tax=Novosphingobium rosa TaxID=76978 RepID=UPI00083640AD|nr:ATP-binding protein [Novosphingobium rosa]
MRPIDLPRTSGFRLGLLFLALFSAASLGIFGFLYVQNRQFQIANIDDWILRESRAPFVAPLPEVRQAFDRHAQSSGGQLTRVFALYGPDGQVLAGDRLPMPRPVAVLDQPFFFDLRVGPAMRHYRGIAHRYAGGEVALMAQDLHDTREMDEAFLLTVLWGGLLTGLLGIAGAVIVGIGTVRRFDAVAQAIQQIVRGDFSRRLPTHGNSGDLDRLAHVVNGMLSDIERLMHDVKGVCDGIAHDLRTPLTRILAGLERSQRQSRTSEEHVLVIDEAIGELRDVLRTFSAMLRIAELEDGARRAGFAQVDLARIVEDAVEFYEPAAEDREIALRLHGPEAGADGLLTMPGDPSLIFDAVSNLIDNAIKFTPMGGQVDVSLRLRAGRIEIGVSDTGCGIPEAERDAVFQRFYRADHSRKTPGNGLGLTLVQAIAKLHHMEIAISPRDPGTGIVLSYAT